MSQKVGCPCSGMEVARPDRAGRVESAPGPRAPFAEGLRAGLGGPWEVGTPPRSPLCLRRGAEQAALPAAPRRRLRGKPDPAAPLGSPREGVRKPLRPSSLWPGPEPQLGHPRPHHAFRVPLCTRTFKRPGPIVPSTSLSQPPRPVSLQLHTCPSGTGERNHLPGPSRSQESPLGLGVRIVRSRRAGDSSCSGWSLLPGNATVGTPGAPGWGWGGGWDGARPQPHPQRPALQPEPSPAWTLLPAPRCPSRGPRRSRSSWRSARSGHTRDFANSL